MATQTRPITIDESLLRAAEAIDEDISTVVEAALRRHLRIAYGEAADLPTMRGAYLKALLDRDARAARAVVDGAVAGGVDAGDLYAEVFHPALAEIGHLWAVETINVAQEHFATSVTQGLIAELRPAVTPAQGRLAIVTSSPDELHQLGSHMVADLLERAGWEVLALGAATPADDLVELVTMECPDVVALSATTAGRLPGLSEVLERLNAIDPRPLIAVGGALFGEQTAEYARSLGADLVLTDVRELVPALDAHLPPVDP